MEITYANGKVEKYFKDYKKMQKKLPFEWVKTIKKHMDRLKAAECFGDFLKLRLGKPEQLEGCHRFLFFRISAVHSNRQIFCPLKRHFFTFSRHTEAI